MTRTARRSPRRPWWLRILRGLRWPALIVVSAPAIILVATAFRARGGPELQPWHTVRLENELRAADVQETPTLDEYLEREDRLFAEVEEKIYVASAPGQTEHFERYRHGSTSDPTRFDPDWNRTFEHVPENVRGGVLMLHGLSDSPYSMRTVADICQRHGLYVLALRLPGHGTIPSGLVDVHRADWEAAVQMGAKHVRERVGPDAPFYIFGYSNGGALAVEYALDAIDDDALPDPDRLILFSPAIGITALARFANWHAVLSWMPYFEKFKWLDLQPEFDPFKYNSFPKNAGAQNFGLTKDVQAHLARVQAGGRMDEMPPILSFQSLIDTTVISADLILYLYERLAANGSEVVFFDTNTAAVLQPFIRATNHDLRDKLTSDATRKYAITMLSNADPDALKIVARTWPPLSIDVKDEPLDLEWPSQVYSLSHVAIPFPIDDPIYGQAAPLGRLEPRGERRLLTIPADNLLRLRYNPFFAYLDTRIERTLNEDLGGGGDS